MKRILYSIIFLSFFLSYSQQKQFKIEWDGTRTLSASTSKTVVPSFNIENFSFDHISGLKFVSQWELNQTINEKSVKLINVTYAPIVLNELKDINIKTIPKQITYVLKNSIARGKRYAYLEVSPIINENGIYKKVLAFTVTYNDVNNYRITSNASAITNSVLGQGSWYKFYIDKTGVFKLSKSFLNKIGVNTNSIDPRTIRIFGQGGNMLPLENSVFYPLDLTENAIKIVGGEDGVFNTNDYLLFYGVGPNGFNAESNTNNNVFIDKSMLFC